MDSSRRALELGVALIMASLDNRIIDICRLLYQGAGVNYADRWMDEGEEKSAVPLIQAAWKP